MRAGFSLITLATSRHVKSPGRTIVSTTTDSAVSRPSMPGLAFANSHIFSCSACGAWPAREPETGGVGPFVGDCADGQPWFLGVLGDQHAEAGGVLEGAAHHQRVVHADAVVGE